MLRKIKQTVKQKIAAAQSSSKKRLLGKFGIAVIVDTPSGLYAVDPEDLTVGGQLLNSGKYAVDEIDLLSKHLSPQSKVLIVGTHIGSLAIPISKKVEFVDAIEANPKTFRLLSMNITLNGIKNIKAHQIAASNKYEKISFLLSRTNSGGSKRVPLVHDSAYYYDQPETIEVDAVPLDEHLQGPFDVIIMDIEGSEFFALSGMPRLLSGAKMLQVEFLPHHLKNVGGVTLSQFVDVIAPYFDQLYIPSLDVTADRSRFKEVLQSMYDAEQGDDGLIFTKA